MLWSASYLVLNELSEWLCLDKQIYPLFLTLGIHTISVFRGLSERERRERDRARYGRLTVKKNAVYCRNGEKVPKSERQTYIL